MKRVSRGFTLIELLVVIAIILVLAGLSFVFVKRGTQAAYSARCMNNLKQICAAQMAIPNDNGGFFIHVGRTRIEGRRRNWAMHFTAFNFDDLTYGDPGREVNKRLFDVQMLNCPSAYADRKTEMREYVNHNGWRTYGLNTRIGVAEQDTEEGAWIDGASRPEQLEAPSLTICAAETSWNTNNNRYNAGFGPGSSRPTEQGMGSMHNDGFHVGYMDGHVERHTMDSFPYQGNQMSGGRTVRYRAGNNATPNDAHWSIVWRGQKFRRTIPSP